MYILRIWLSFQNICLSNWEFSLKLRKFWVLGGKDTWVKQKFEWWFRLILDIGFVFTMYIFVRWILAKRNDTWIMNLSNMHKSMYIMKIWLSFWNICLSYWEFSLKLWKFWVLGEKEHELNKKLSCVSGWYWILALFS